VIGAVAKMGRASPPSDPSHASPQQTSVLAGDLNTYGHVFLSIQREAASKMDAILGGVAVTVAVKEGLKQVQ
jgi:hypothetical protein